MEIIKTNEELIKAVDDMGFGSLKYLPAVKMEFDFIKKLLDRFDVNSCSIFGVNIKVEDVGRILGVPAEGKLIPTSISDADKHNFKLKFSKKSLKMLASELKTLKEADINFKETFMLYTLGHFFCPSTKEILSGKLYKAISVLPYAREYNWGQFILENLLEGIKDYQKRTKGANSKGRNIGISGCIYCLKVFFLQRMHPLAVESGKPVFSAWTHAKIKLALKEDLIERAKRAGPPERVRPPDSTSTEHRLVALEQAVFHKNPSASPLLNSTNEGEKKEEGFEHRLAMLEQAVFSHQLSSSQLVNIKKGSKDNNTEKADKKLKYYRRKFPKKPVIKVVSTTVDTLRENMKSGHVDSLGLNKGVKIDRKPDNLEDKRSKKVKVNCTGEERNSNIIEKIIVDSDISCAKNVVTSRTFYGERTNSKVTIDSNGLQGPSNKDKLDDKMKALSNGKLPKMPASISGCGDSETRGNISDITRRPDALFKNRVQSAQKDGTILVLHNLDPEYVSVEVEEIIWHSFKERCMAEVVHQTTIFTPLSGQAIVIFETREGTERIMRKLAEGCLMLPNGRPLVCSIPPTYSENQPAYYGHLVIDKKNRLQRETKDSVSTSHCSLPYTVEYNMAMEWCLLQLRSDGCWNRLYKRQGQEISKLMAKFKSK